MKVGSRDVDIDAEVTSVVDVLEELLARRRQLLRELKRFEKRFGMRTEEFIEAWRRGADTGA